MMTNELLSYILVVRSTEKPRVFQNVQLWRQKLHQDPAMQPAHFVPKTAETIAVKSAIDIQNNYIIVYMIKIFRG